jgi:hypothetical protein
VEARLRPPKKLHSVCRFNIGHINRTLSQFADATGSRIWVLIDEWSVLPEVLQPYLADFIKRTLFPIRNFSVQIAAIEQRSHFRVGSGTATFGIELGSDASADINLDDYLVADNNPQRSMNFFREFLFRHLVALDQRLLTTVPTSEAFVAATFTQGPAFRELVRACEGVPRDIINIQPYGRARISGVNRPYLANPSRPALLWAIDPRDPDALRSGRL